MWINVNDKLPLGYQTVLVRVDGEYAIAEYDKHFGFNADWSGLNIYADDDSGLGVSLSGDVTHWMALPAAPQDIVETKPEQHTTGTLQKGSSTESGILFARKQLQGTLIFVPTVANFLLPNTLNEDDNAV